jgi:hypothetical protein
LGTVVDVVDDVVVVVGALVVVVVGATVVVVVGATVVVVGATVVVVSPSVVVVAPSVVVVAPSVVVVSPSVVVVGASPWHSSPLHESVGCALTMLSAPWHPTHFVRSMAGGVPAWQFEQSPMMAECAGTVWAGGAVPPEVPLWHSPQKLGHGGRRVCVQRDSHQHGRADQREHEQK